MAKKPAPPAPPPDIELHITPSNKQQITAHEVATALQKKLMIKTEMDKIHKKTTVTILANKRTP